MYIVHIILTHLVNFALQIITIINCRRRCMVVETLAEKHFDLAFRMLHEFDLPGINIGLNL